MTDIKSLTIKEIEELLLNMGEAKFHGKQIFSWIHKGVSSFDEMTDLSLGLRMKLSESCILTNATLKKSLVSSDGETTKLLFEFADGNSIETVLMKYKHGYTVCLSTQAGCRMGCVFCASTRRGLARNLTSGEILEQLLFTERTFCVKITNIVLMGTGEPLDNFDNVMKFLQLVTDKNGVNIGIRHISLSTCGLVDKIYELCNRHMGLTLSVSLHAPNDEIRSKIMPINKKWCISELIKAIKKYTEETKRRVAVEYTLIKNINCSQNDARALAVLLKGMLVHVNLIPLNPSAECGYECPSKREIKEFLYILTSAGISATVRRELGRDINAACGQLRLTNNGKGEMPV